MLSHKLQNSLKMGYGRLCFRAPIRLLTNSLAKPEDYVALPQYPPIKDLSFKAKKNQKNIEWHEKIASLSTVEEKLFEINMPKYYGYKAHIISDQKVPYNALPFAQYATRTYFFDGKLPESYENLKKYAKDILKGIRNDLEDVIEFEMRDYKSALNESEEIITSALLNTLNRKLISYLATKYEYLNDVDFDINPRHEAFWFLGGIAPPTLLRKIKEGVEWQKPYSNDPYDRKLQYVGKPYFTLRHRNPLSSAKNVDLSKLDIKQDNIDIGEFRFDPLTLGYVTEQRHATTIPGFWPGEPHEFGLISFQRRNHAKLRHTYCSLNDLDQALHAQGIFSSYAWLLGQACYQGFSTFNDVTYPLTTQTIITDGQTWSFYVYQLNTTLVHSDKVDTNPRYNFCWGTKQIQLFDHIDENGKIHGLNDEVLENIISFYINEPKPFDDLELKPYLCKTESRIADIINDNRRVFMEQAYKHCTSNRPRHLSIPEIYSWEKIYKVDNKTRPMEPKRRPFELGENMYNRRMDEHALRYIPRNVRPGGPKSKPKFESIYYPNVRR